MGRGYGAFFRAIFPGWSVAASHCINSGLPYGAAGGVAILSSPRLAQQAIMSKCILFPGRCIGVSYKSGDKVFDVINIRNASLSCSGLRNITEYVETLRSRDFASPMESSSLRIGDMNFMAPNDRRFVAGRPMAGSMLAAPSTSSTFQQQWMRELKNWVELDQPFPTIFLLLAIPVPGLIGPGVLSHLRILSTLRSPLRFLVPLRIMRLL